MWRGRIISKKNGRPIDKLGGPLADPYNHIQLNLIRATTTVYSRYSSQVSYKDWPDISGLL